MQAILRPKHRHHEAQLVTLLGRVGRDQVKVELVTEKTKRIFAAERFRLFSIEDRRMPVARHLLDALDWIGAGADPLATASPPSATIRDNTSRPTGDL